jgi:hypothetical protein
MPETVRAVVVDRSSPQGLAVKPVGLAPATPDEVTVRVTAVSLNRGKVRRATSQGQPGDRPGWDFAGVVEERAANGRGPPAGSRVVGMLPSGAWAERVRAPSHAVAALPEPVSDAQAATLPVAGLTALHGLRQGGLLRGRNVLVDGASGGVGHLAIQLAAGSHSWPGSSPDGRFARTSRSRRRGPRSARSPASCSTAPSPARRCCTWGELRRPAGNEKGAELPCRSLPRREKTRFRRQNRPDLSPRRALNQILTYYELEQAEARRQRNGRGI